MLRALLLATLLVSCSHALDKKQVKGLKKLLKKLPEGVFLTCKLVLFSELVDYDTADHKCSSFNIGTAVPQNGNLATVNDNDKNDDLKLLLSMAYPETPENKKDKWGPTKWVWAGLRKVHNNVTISVPKPKKNKKGKKKNKGEEELQLEERKAKKGAYDALDWNWHDGSNPKSFHNWLPGQPDQDSQKKGEKDCKEEKCYQNQMRINHKGMWDDTYKYKKHPYACDYQGKYIISATPKKWPDAKLACEEAGLIMAKVRSKEEVDEIKAAALFYLGPKDDTLRVFDPMNWIWLGANDKDKEGEWQWNDGKPLDKTWVANMPWRRPNPDNAELIGDVGQDALSISKDGEFDDSYDTKRKRPFACQCPGT